VNHKNKWFLYIGASLVFLVFWLIWVFPYDALKSRIVTEIENRSRGLYRLEVGEMDLSLLGSLTLHKLSVFERTKGGEISLLKTPKMKIGFSPFAIFSDKIDFSFYIQGSRGEMEGDYRQEAEEWDLNVQFDDFPISDLPYLNSKAKIGLKGNLNGELRIKLNRADANKNSGNIDLEFADLIMEPTKLSLDPSAPEAAVDIPQIKLTGSEDSGIKGEVQKEDLVLQSVTLKGGDVDLDLSGKISLLGMNAKDYRLAFQGSLKVAENLIKALPFLLMLEQQKTPEGVYPINISGRLGKPSIRIGRIAIPI
jgi:type II secretion system protein N